MPAPIVGGAMIVIIPTAVIAGGAVGLGAVVGLAGFGLWKLLARNGPTVSLNHIKTVIDTEPHATVENLRLYIRKHYKMPRFVKLELYIRRGEERVILQNDRTLADYGISSANGATVYVNIHL